MANILFFLIGLCLAIVSLGSLAQNAEEHKTHHPDGAASHAATNKKSSANSVNADKMAAMDKQMKEMQIMHEKMTSAKTQDERQTLMTEHMKVMQDGMGMMKQMGGMSGMGGMQAGKGMSYNMTDRQQMMEKRMDMIESMMQMMVDHTPFTATK